jgi:hypothetical protein
MPLCVLLEILTAVVIKTFIYRNKRPCSPAKVNRRFGGICHVISIFKTEEATGGMLIPKRPLTFIGLQGVMSQKINFPYTFCLPWFLTHSRYICTCLSVCLYACMSEETNERTCAFWNTGCNGRMYDTKMISTGKIELNLQYFNRVNPSEAVAELSKILTVFACSFGT